MRQHRWLGWGRIHVKFWRRTRQSEIDIAGQRHVEHFFNRYGHDNCASFIGKSGCVGQIFARRYSAIDRIIAVKIYWDSREFDGDCGLQISFQPSQKFFAASIASSIHGTNHQTLRWI